MGQDKVAVLPFKQQTFLRDDGNIFSDRVTIELFKLGKYQVIDRNDIDLILEEQGFQNSGFTDESIHEIGKILGVKYIITGSLISNYGYPYTSFSISAKMISVESAEIVSVGSFDYKGSFQDLVKNGANSIALQLAGQTPPNYDYSMKNKSYGIIEITGLMCGSCLLIMILAVL